MEWLVEVKGERADLEELANHLDWPELDLTQAKQDFVLKSTDFSSLEDPDDVYEKSRQLIDEVNRAASLAVQLSQPLTVAKVIRINDDGSRNSFVYFSASCSARTRVILRGYAVRDKDGNIQEFRLSDYIRKIIKVSRHDKSVNKALRLYLGPHDWVNLYRIYEIIKHDVG